MIPSPALAVVLLAGLAPFFWVKFGSVAKAEDFILPMTLEQWAEFFSTWQSRVGFGSSPDDRLAATFFLFWPALFRAIGASIELAQRLQFVLWFTAMGLSMYILMRQLTRSQIAWAAASLIYMFNFYQEPVWQGVNIANLSALVAMPLALAITIRFTAGARLLPSAALLALISVIGSGVGANPPMALIAIVPAPLYMILYFGQRRITGQRAEARQMLSFAAVALVGVVLVNAYWLMPQSYGLLSGGPGQNFLGRTKLDAFTQLFNLSSFTGPLNVWRLQGAWVWYDSFRGVPYIPYAPSYLQNPLLIIGSFALPAAALLGFLASRGRRLTYFALVGMLGLILSMGVNGPFGQAYGWLWENVPLFWVVRSPWYKATALTMLGLSPLAGIGITRCVSFVVEAVAKVKFTRWIPEQYVRSSLVLLILVLFLAYNAPVVRGAFFMDRPADSPLPGLQVQMPEYLTQAADWLESHPENFRILALPPSLRQTTDWGFTSYIPPLGELTTKSFINLVEPSEMPAAIYRFLLKSDAAMMSDLLAYAGIRYVMVQHDVSSPQLDSILQEPVETLLARHNLELEVSFGPLDFYRVHAEKPRLWATDRLLISSHGMDSLPSLTALLGADSEAILIDSQVEPDIIYDLLTNLEGEDPLQVRILGSGLDLALDLISRVPGEAIVFPAGTTSGTISVPEPGVYEVWQKREQAEITGLDPQARMLLTMSTMKIGDQHVLVEGQPLTRLGWEPEMEEVHTWEFLGTFDSTSGETDIRIWGLSAWVESSTLLVINEHDRREVVASLSATTDRIQGFLSALPDDVSDESGRSLRVAPLQAWGDEVVSEAGEVTRRILLVQKYFKNLLVENDLDAERSIAMVLQPKSFENSRSLWIKVGDEFVSTFVISPDVRHEIVVQGIQLPPGESWINLYSPDPDTEFSGNEYASFDYLFPFRAGPLTRQRTFSLDVDASYRLMVGLLHGPNGENSPSALLRSFKVDGVEYLPHLERDAANTSHPAAFLDLDLAAGEHDLMVDQRIGTTLPVLLTRVRDPRQSSSTQIIEYDSSRGSSATARIESDGPYLLILNELYDPRWSAFVDGERIDLHFKVNGFANAFYVPRGGNHVVEIRFDIQTLATASLAVSGVTIFSILAMLSVGVLRRKLG